MLCTLTRSPWQCDINTLLRMLHAGDDLLLIQDGVLAGVINSHIIKTLQDFPIIISALKEDIEARGLIEHISSKIAVINYADFVNLVVKNASHMKW